MKPMKPAAASRKTPEVAKTSNPRTEIQSWPIDKFVIYTRNPRKNDAAIGKMCASIEEFGFKIPCLVRSDGELIDGHLRLKAARKLGIGEIPVLLCDEWTPAQVKAFRLMVNRSASWAEWDDELLAAELQELRAADFDLSLTGFDPSEIEEYTLCEVPQEDEAPPPPVRAVSGPGDLWLCGAHRVLCGDATKPEDVTRLLDGRKPLLLITDPPYGIELDSEWRDRAGLNGHGPATSSYMKRRTAGHRVTSISGDTRADWSEAFALVPTLEVGYVWHASRFTREVLDGLLRIGFEHHQQIIWDKERAVLTRTHYWFQHEPCWYVRKKNAPWYGKPGENATIWSSPSPKFIMGGSEEEKYDHPTQKPVELMRKPILNHSKAGELVYEPFLGSGTTLVAAETTRRICLGMELAPEYVDVVVERWQKLTGKQATLEGAGRTFGEVASASEVSGVKERIQGHGSKFSRNKETAVQALCTQRNLEEAARAAGISKPTLVRWLKLPEFQEAYRQARHATVGQADARLQQASTAAAATLVKIMLDQATPPPVRLRAAHCVLEQAHRATYMEEFETRLITLEMAAEEIRKVSR